MTRTFAERGVGFRRENVERVGFNDGGASSFVAAGAFGGETTHFGRDDAVGVKTVFRVERVFQTDERREKIRETFG